MTAGKEQPIRNLSIPGILTSARLNSKRLACCFCTECPPEQSGHDDQDSNGGDNDLEQQTDEGEQEANCGNQRADTWSGRRAIGAEISFLLVGRCGFLGGEQYLFDGGMQRTSIKGFGQTGNAVEGVLMIEKV